MTKRKSKRWAKFKVLLILPLLSFLVLTFADSNTTREPDKAKQKDAENALITQGDEKDSTHAKDQKKAEEEKKKNELAKKAQEEAKKIEMSIKELKEKYKETDDPEMKKKIKEKAAALEKKMMKLKQAQGEVLANPEVAALEVETLKKLLEKTDDPEKKKQIKKKIAELQNKKEMNEEKKIEMTIKELEKKYKATDDPELKKKIKEKLSQLKTELKKKKK